MDTLHTSPTFRFALLVFAIVTLGVALTAGKTPIDGDATLMCASASTLTRTGSLSLKETYRDDSVIAPDGAIYTNYPLLAIVQCIPAQGLRGIGRGLGFEDGAITLLLTALWPALITGVLAVLFFYLALAVSLSPRVAALGAVALVFTTPHWVYGHLLYSENLQAVTLAAAALCWITPGHQQTAARLLLGGFCLAVCVHAKTPLALMLFCALLYQLSLGQSPKQVGRSAAYAALGGLPLLLLFLWYNQIRFGDPFTLGYANARAKTIGFGTPFLVGLHGLLLSPGKSIFVYGPFLLLAFPGARLLLSGRRQLFWLLLLPPILLTLLFSKWWAWGGDWGWGPRLLLPATPFLFLAALSATRVRSIRRWLAAPLLLLGLLVNLLGVVINPSHYLQVVLQTLRPSILPGDRMVPIRDDLAIVHFVPEFSPPLGHFWILRQTWLGSWFPTDWFPWKGIGLAAWNVRSDPRPAAGLDLWYDGSTTASIVLVVGVAALLAALLYLVRALLRR